MGLLGYGSSFATTFTDVEAPLSTGLHETAQPIVSDYTVTIIEAAIAIIVVVIIAIAIVGALIIRKR
jgi:hypothetical protein